MAKYACRSWASCGPMQPMTVPRVCRIRALLMFAPPTAKPSWPIAHLAGFKGILPIDGYAGYRKLADRGDVRLAFCWSHVRRNFYEPATGGPAPIASTKTGARRGVFDPVPPLPVAMPPANARADLESEVRGRRSSELLPSRAASFLRNHKLFDLMASRNCTVQPSRPLFRRQTAKNPGFSQ